MGQQRTNNETHVHWRKKAAGGFEVIDWQIVVHLGDDGINETFPVVYGATMYSDLRTKAATSSAAFHTFCDNATGAWGDAWDALNTQTKADLYEWFRDKASASD